MAGIYDNFESSDYQTAETVPAKVYDQFVPAGHKRTAGGGGGGGGGGVSQAYVDNGDAATLAAAKAYSGSPSNTIILDDYLISVELYIDAAVARAQTALGITGGTIQLGTKAIYPYEHIVLNSNVFLVGNVKRADTPGNNASYPYNQTQHLESAAKVISISFTGALNGFAGTVASAAGLKVGMALHGTPFKPGTYIASISGTTIGLNWAIQAAATSVACQAHGCIAMNGGAGVYGLHLIRNGMVFPTPNASAFAGTGFIAMGDGTTIQDIEILGLAHGFYSIGNQRTRAEGVAMDVLNGLYLGWSYDSSRLRSIQIWPFSSPSYDPGVIGQTAAYVALGRTGFGYKFEGPNDDTNIDNCFAGYHTVNWWFNDTGAISVGRIWSDQLPDAAPSDSIGLAITGQVDNLKFDSAELWGSRTLLYLSHASVPGATNLVTFDYLYTRQTRGRAIDHANGDLSVGTWRAQDCLTTEGGLAQFAGGAGSTKIRIDKFWDQHFGATTRPILLNGTMWTDDIKINVVQSTRTAGIGLYASGMVWRGMTAAATLDLPLAAERIELQGAGATIATINGAWGARQTTFKPLAGHVFSTTGNIRLGDTTRVGPGLLTLEFEPAGGYWYETGWCPFTPPAPVTPTLPGAWTAFNPNFIPESGTFGSVTQSGRYEQIGKTVRIHCELYVASIGSGTGVPRLSLPVTPLGRVTLYGSELDVNGKMVQVRTYAGQGTYAGLPVTTAHVVYFDSSSAVPTSGVRITIEGQYEAA